MNAVADRVQTSGPDLFGDEAPRPIAPAQQMAFTGRLRTKPHVAMVQLDAGHFVPALCLELVDVGVGHHSVNAHVLYTDATRAQCEAEARRLQRGQCITVATSLTDIRLQLPAACLISNDTP